MTKLAYDMSSYIKTAMLAGVDSVDGQRVEFDGKSLIVNSAAYGYENVTNMMLKTMRDCGLQPRDCLLVPEGMQSKSKRMLISVSYKAGRDKRPPEFYEQFQILRDYVEAEWLAMGALRVKQDYVEGDDTLAWLAQNTEEDLIIATRDGDLSVLNTMPGETNAYGATIKTYNDGLVGVAKLDGELFAHPFKYITLYKGLVGDTSDSISGVKGFGPAKFQTLAEKYGYDGLDELIGLLQKGNLDPLHELAEEMAGKKPAHPIIKLIVANEADAIKSYKLALMYPGWVNTVRSPLQVTAGKLEELVPERDKRLHEYFGQTRMIDADNYDDALVFFREQMPVTEEPTFDIETSTPDESDDWLLAQGNPDGVDQIGSVLTGFSFTFGANMQYTFYVSADHRDTRNVTMQQARYFMQEAFNTNKPIVIQNTMFELGVLHFAKDQDGTLWRDCWADCYPGYRGFIPNVLDTKIEANYTNENIKTGLKLRSKTHLNYDQETFEQVTSKSGPKGTLPAGGRLRKEETNDDGVVIQTRQYKMRELTAEHVMSYGADDTICTAALHNYYKFMMQTVDHHWQVYLDTEIGACYQHAKNFVDGMKFSLQRSKELEREDDVTFDKAWGIVREFLMQHGWEGTVPPLYGPDITVKQIKHAYKIVNGLMPQGPQVSALPDEMGDEDAVVVEAEDDEDEDEVSKDAILSTKVRKPANIVPLLRAEGHELFATMVEACIDGGGAEVKFTNWVNEHFTGEPEFKTSPKQMGHLMYTVMALPVRIFGKATKIMRAAGRTQGNAKTDTLAIEYALRDATPAQKEVLASLKLMQMVKTRRGLYYTKYPYFVHWMTGMIHPTHNQSNTNTRRASESKPNGTQMPKNAKIVGQPAKFRETIVPHHPDAVIVSLDEDSQELRLIANYSHDTNMVACFVGENKKDMHALTGHGIALKKLGAALGMTYDEFAVAAKDKGHLKYDIAKLYRGKGKTTNFATEFGAMAPKLAQTMLVTEAEAQTYIDAKEAMFPGVRVWKDAEIALAKRTGRSYTLSGAVRHLAEAFNSDDHWIKSKAERQSVNFKIQSSGAEMLKKAEGRVWELGLTYKYDCICYGPKHDELVFSVMKKDLLEFLKEAHWCMVQPYGGMFIPIVSSISFGPNFGVQAEIGSEPTAEAVSYGWKQLEDLKHKTAVQIS